jgi:hypothetical protein
MELNLTPDPTDNLDCITEKLCSLADQLHLTVKCIYRGCELESRPGADPHWLKAVFHRYNGLASYKEADNESELSRKFQQERKQLADEAYRTANAEKRF